ncbi:hypothetical protein D3M96_17305 [Alcaligenes aquatilis]|uniref:Uncharacterized protein n=1 Tax=Alcaligenes aquatilis TaxID=323284 RepID=A0A3G2HYB9_9BURK|nr:hypothetical protein D3M96_17305 [Alcaligenes aquatilis]
MVVLCCASVFGDGEISDFCWANTARIIHLAGTRRKTLRQACRCSVGSGASRGAGEHLQAQVLERPATPYILKYKFDGPLVMKRMPMPGRHAMGADAKIRLVQKPLHLLF